MIKKRIIPIVLTDGISVIKTIKFNTRRNLGSLITTLRTYNTRNVDELVLLDIDATKNNTVFDKFLLRDLSKECFMPLTVGGGIKSLNQIEDLLSCGADKVAINSYGLKNPQFLVDAARVFGSQCIVVSVDVLTEEDGYKIFSPNHFSDESNLNKWLEILNEVGVGEILINHVSKDGTMSGPDLDLARQVSKISSRPVIFTGGIGSPSDCAKVIELSGVDAVGVSSIFHFTNATPEDCRLAISEKGYPVRLH